MQPQQKMMQIVGVPTLEDCDDSDAATITDMDCDGVPTLEDCDDHNALVWDSTNDGDCDGVPTLEDCDDSNPDIYYQVERKNMLYVWLWIFSNFSTIKACCYTNILDNLLI